MKKLIIVLLVLVAILLPVSVSADASGFEEFQITKGFEQIADFQSVSELKNFLAQDDTDHHIYLIASEDGSVILNNQCVQIAMQLRNRAFVKGKYLSLQVLDYEKPISHMVCMAVIGREIYFIEPATDRVWLNSYVGGR